MLDLEFYHRNIRWLGILAIVISALTWTADLTGFVYECPYCRVQRTVIGLLGVIALLPNPAHWIARYVAAVLAALGVVVGATQHFGGWRKIFSGKFELGDDWYINSFFLSGFALFIIIGLLLLFFSYRKEGAPAA